MSWEDIYKMCMSVPKVKEVVELIDEINFDMNKPKEEFDLQSIQEKLVNIEKKFTNCGASQPMVIYLNSRFFYELGRFKKAMDPLSSQKFFEDSINIASYLKDTKMIQYIKLELAELYMLKKEKNFTKFAYELAKEFEQSKDLFRHARLLCIFAQYWLRDESQSAEFATRRACSQFSLAINKLKNATGYDQYFLKIFSEQKDKKEEKFEIQENEKQDSEENKESTKEISKEDDYSSLLKNKTKEQKNHISWLLNILIVNAELKMSLKEYADAIDILREGKLIAMNESRLNKHIQMIGKMADIYFNCSEWETCMECYLDCIKALGDKKEHNPQLSILYANVGVCLKNLKRYDESVEYKKQAFERMVTVEDKFEILVQMGELFIYTDVNSHKAKKAMDYFSQARKLLEEPHKVIESEIAKLDLGVAIATYMMKNYEDSIKLFEDTIPKLEPQQKASSNYYLSMMYHERGNMDQAIECVLKGLTDLAPNLYSKSVVLERLYEGKRHQLLSKLLQLYYEKKDFTSALVAVEKYRALNLISILKLDGSPMSSIGPYPKLANFLALTGLNFIEYFVSLEFIKVDKANVVQEEVNDKEDIDEKEEKVETFETEFEKREFLYVFVVSTSGNIKCLRFDVEKELKEQGFEEKKVGDAVFSLRKNLGIVDDEKESHLLESKISSVAELKVDKENLEKANKYLKFFYNVLIGPVLPFIESEDLVIAPTKDLFLIPFSCLEDKNGEAFVSQPYNISITPSLSALIAIRECNLSPTREPENKAFILSSPSPMASLTNSITDGTLGLTSLPTYTEHWKEEQSKILESWNNSQVATIISSTEKESSTEFFYKNYTKCKYVHLSTHVGTEEVSPSVAHYGKIALATNEESSVNGWISAHLTNYRLPFCSEVVSLSSVVTLAGKIRGENFSESLQSFIRSGSQSVLSPQCSFPNHSISSLFSHFYKFLSKFSDNKAKALRLATLEFKKELGDSCPSPALWGSFLLFGSTDPFIENLGMLPGVSQYNFL
eukprot:TRINITY_DN5161_c0_g1_i1.p1 TRINITY_DN5161_c0_g1~~TRINITY_DN5161_c0_g1_i1.p1  ORF type:complete len:1011 (-),score=347.03 TRINITY_DN5161_c0_g1_i1:90-3122(-)